LEAPLLSSTITRGDYDLVSQDQAEVEAALMALGFEKPRDGTRGLHHYEANVGVEIVGSELLDGHADRTRILEVEIAEGLIIKQRQPLLSPQVGAAIERDRGEEDHAGKLGMTKSPAHEKYPPPRRKAEDAALFRPTSLDGSTVSAQDRIADRNGGGRAIFSNACVVRLPRLAILAQRLPVECVESVRACIVQLNVTAAIAIGGVPDNISAVALS
jgi:hypothetical protein